MMQYVQVPLRTEIERTGWVWTVFGITHERVFTDGTTEPFTFFVSVHKFRFMANRSAKRWLEGILNGTRQAPVIIEAGTPPGAPSGRWQWKKDQ